MRAIHNFLWGKQAESRKLQLDRLGFVWDLNEHTFQKFYDALEEYALRDRSNSSGKRHLRVPTEFIVPHGKESGWPEELWGYPLGAKCSEVRRKEMYVKHYPRRKKALERLGFSWSGNATLGWLDVVHAAATYSQINGGKLDVPFKFVVPSPPHYTSSGEVSGRSDPWPWPERLWGFPLGQRLKDIRVRGSYLRGKDAAKRTAQLDALGFNWTPKRGRPRTQPPDDE